MNYIYYLATEDILTTVILYFTPFTPLI